MVSPRTKNGFTLLELSLVLTIVGLIIGGTLMGRSMIKAAQLHQTINDVSTLNAVVNSFVTKYGQLPGDFTQATQLWGAAATCPISYWSGSPSDTLTCDGDGNGQVLAEETFSFFGQLSNSGLITQKIYSGGCCGSFTTQPTGYPSSAYGGIASFRGTGAGFLWIMNGASAAVGVDYPQNYTFAPDNQPWFLLGAVGGNLANFLPVMTTSDAAAIDEKMDDGLPGKGRVQTWCFGIGIVTGLPTPCRCVPLPPIPTQRFIIRLAKR